MCKTIILPAVLYGCGAWSLIQCECYRLRLFEYRVLRRIFMHNSEKRQEAGEDRIMKMSITCNFRQILLSLISTRLN